MNTPIQLISSMATRALLADIAVRYRDETGCEVLVESTGAVHAVQRIEAGEVFDGVVLSSPAVDRLVAAGKVLDPRTDFTRSGVAVAVPAGAARPDIGNEDAVRQAVLAAPALAYSTGASGIALAQLFQRWGIAEAIQSRLVVPPPGVPVGTLLASGQVALGFQQLSELQGIDGIDILGTLPDGIRIDTIFCAALTARAMQVEATQRFFAFLNAPALADTKRASGMSPI